MKKQIDIHQARDLFSEAEQTLHRSLNILLSIAEESGRKRAIDYFQMCLIEYTDAARIWGSVEGGLAAKELFESELETYEPGPAIAEMN